MFEEEKKRENNNGRSAVPFGTRKRNGGDGLTKLKDVLINDQDGFCGHCFEEIKGKQRIFKNLDYGVICSDCYAEIGSGHKEGKRGEHVEVARAEFDKKADKLYKLFAKTPPKEEPAENVLSTYLGLCTEIKSIGKAYYEKTGERVGGYRNQYDEKSGKSRVEYMANVLVFQAEQVMRKREREAARDRSRQEWEVLERQHTLPVTMSMEDIYDHYMTKFENGKITKGEAESEINKYRECAHIFCINAFKPRHGHQKYCCDQHKEAESDAKDRLKDTGTYLPKHTYLSNLERYEQEKYEKNTFIANGDFIDQQFGRRDDENIARITRGDSDKRGFKRDQRARVNKKGDIRDQLQKHKEFVSGNGNPILKVEINTGKIYRKTV